MVDVTSGTYRVTRWNTWNGTPTSSQIVSAPTGSLTVSLPAPLAADIAMKFERVSDQQKLYLPLITK
jgi:hypothetical protein